LAQRRRKLVFELRGIRPDTLARKNDKGIPHLDESTYSAFYRLSRIEVVEACGNEPGAGIRDSHRRQLVKQNLPFWKVSVDGRPRDSCSSRDIRHARLGALMREGLRGSFEDCRRHALLERRAPGFRFRDPFGDRSLRHQRSIAVYPCWFRDNDVWYRVDVVAF
jgi:hypothetical protein